ncbi:hypothetical protein PR048_032633 [Dryococelus australis]|uniref:Uncharacterized protein n=1 Tax=Dryococelus australis TaxID=614101 RepID=A0ABQ9G5Q7_9NEOP|nr:hypothetical protein PR048_032633 [Dryococelus australis]
MRVKRCRHGSESECKGRGKREIREKTPLTSGILRKITWGDTHREPSPVRLVKAISYCNALQPISCIISLETFQDHMLHFVVNATGTSHNGERTNPKGVKLNAEIFQDKSLQLKTSINIRQQVRELLSLLQRLTIPLATCDFIQNPFPYKEERHGISLPVCALSVVLSCSLSSGGLVHNSWSAVEWSADLLRPRTHVPTCVSTITTSEAKLSNTGARVHQIRRRPKLRLRPNSPEVHTCAYLSTEVTSQVLSELQVKYASIQLANDLGTLGRRAVTSEGREHQSTVRRPRTTARRRKLKLANDLGTLGRRAVTSEGREHQSTVRRPRTSYCGCGLMVFEALMIIIHISPLQLPGEVEQWLNFGLAFGTTGFESRSGHPYSGFPWFPDITPGESWDGHGSIPPINMAGLGYQSAPAGVKRFGRLLTARSLEPMRVIEGRGKREIPEKTRRPTTSSGTIPTCENPVTRPGIEPGSPWWEASGLISQPPWPRLLLENNFLEWRPIHIPQLYAAPKFSRDLRFPPPLHSGAFPYSPRFTPTGSQDIEAPKSLLFTPLHADEFLPIPVYLEAANRSAAEKRSRSKLLMKTVRFEGETTAIGTRSKGWGRVKETALKSPGDGLDTRQPHRALVAEVNSFQNVASSAASSPGISPPPPPPLACKPTVPYHDPRHQIIKDGIYNASSGEGEVEYLNEWPAILQRARQGTTRLSRRPTQDSTRDRLPNVGSPPSNHTQDLRRRSGVTVKKHSPPHNSGPGSTPRSRFSRVGYVADIVFLLDCLLGVLPLTSPQYFHHCVISTPSRLDRHRTHRVFTAARIFRSVSSKIEIFFIHSDYRTMQRVDGFSWGTPVYPAFAPFSPYFTLIGSHDLVDMSHPNLSTQLFSEQPVKSFYSDAAFTEDASVLANHCAEAHPRNVMRITSTCTYRGTPGGSMTTSDAALSRGEGGISSREELTSACVCIRAARILKVDKGVVGGSMGRGMFPNMPFSSRGRDEQAVELPRSGDYFWLPRSNHRRVSIQMPGAERPGNFHHAQSHGGATPQLPPGGIMYWGTLACPRSSIARAGSQFLLHLPRPVKISDGCALREIGSTSLRCVKTLRNSWHGRVDSERSGSRILSHDVKNRILKNTEIKQLSTNQQLVNYLPACNPANREPLAAQNNNKKQQQRQQQRSLRVAGLCPGAPRRGRFSVRLSHWESISRTASLELRQYQMSRHCQPMRMIEVRMERAGMNGRGKREIPEKTRRPTIPTCENPE